MRLSNKLTAWLIVFSVGFIIVGLYTMRSYRNIFEEQVQSESVERSGEALKLLVNRAFDREWSSIEALANGADINDAERLNRMTNTMPQASRKLQWVGVVSPTGVIEYGTGGAEVGKDVSKARWFHNALRGPTLSEPFRAPVGDALEEFIDMAQPIRNASNGVEGIIVYRVRMSWLKDLLFESATSLRLDAFITDTAGNVVVEANAISDGPPSAAALQAARLSLLKSYMPVATNHNGFVSASIPRLLGDSVRGNDWSLIVRMPGMLPASVGGAAWQHAELTLVLAAMGVMGALIFAVRLFLGPIEIQTRALAEFAQGKMVYPKEFKSSREARELGAAIALIQTRLDTLTSRPSSKTARPEKAAPAEKETVVAVRPGEPPVPTANVYRITPKRTRGGGGRA